MASPTIENVYPANESTGIPTGATIWVIFSEEVDPTTIVRAFLVEGPDSDRWTGAGLQTFDRPATPLPDFFLDSPDYQGILQGTFEVVKLDSSGDEVSQATYSYGQASWKSKVIFTPNDHMSALTDYTVFVNGDDLSTDDIKVGISSRTVYDTQYGSNTGDGEATLSGGYTGVISDQFVVEITTAGDIGTAEYQWYRTSDPVTIHTGTTSTNETELEDGVYLVFDGSGFDVDDSFFANVRPPSYMEGTSTWTFTTGSGSITTVSSTTSTSVIGDVGSVSVDTTPFGVTESNPAHMESQVSTRTKTITVDFSANLDSDTVTQDTVRVYAYPARGEFTGNTIEGGGEIPKVLSVSGSRLTIKI